MTWPIIFLVFCHEAPKPLPVVLIHMLQKLVKILGFTTVPVRAHSFLWHVHRDTLRLRYKDMGGKGECEAEQTRKVTGTVALSRQQPLPATVTNTAYISNFLSSTFSYWEWVSDLRASSMPGKCSITCGTSSPNGIVGAGDRGTYVLLL